MRIALLSDTHGPLEKNAFKYFDSVDEIWHAGDIGNIEVADELAAYKPLRAVYGNIDGQDVRIVHPKDQRFLCEELDVWMTHIGGYPGRYSMEISEKLKTKAPGLFICGHSHILKVIYDKRFNMLHINPGAAGVHGFHLVKTLVRFTVNKKNISDLEVVELGKRG